MTLAFEDANSKLVEVDTVVEVDDEDRIGNSLLQIWKLTSDSSNRFAADFFKRSSLLWMRRSRGRGRPSGCGRHQQGVAGQGNISDLNPITDID